MLTGGTSFCGTSTFAGKYTAPNRYATTTRQLRRYADTRTLEALYRVKERLLTVERADIRHALSLACEIRGWGRPARPGCSP